MVSWTSRWLCAGLCATASIAGAAPFALAEFKAKTVNLVVGFPPGGGFDTYARVFARHYGRHLPGTPSVVVQNQPGGGSLNLANLTYNTAPKDGSHLALFSSSAALEPLLGNPLAKFETARFVWIGNINKDVSSCGAWHTSGIKTWDDAIKRPVKFGGSGPGAISSQHGFFLKHLFQPKFGVIIGYGGTNDINLAMQRGEADASCGLFVSSARGPYRQDIEAGNLNIFLQFGERDEPFFKGAANIYKLLGTPEDRQLAQFVFGQNEITRPLAVPPGTPDDVVEAMRRAFDATVRDAGLLADAAKGQIEIEPMSGAETARAFETFAAAPKSLIERSRTVLSAPK